MVMFMQNYLMNTIVHSSIEKLHSERKLPQVFNNLNTSSIQKDSIPSYSSLMSLS